VLATPNTSSNRRRERIADCERGDANDGVVLVGDTGDTGPGVLVALVANGLTPEEDVGVRMGEC
jgi:hypothetical protein